MARRAGFTMMEMLTVMLVIITVLAMGVPAMFAADRQSWVSAAIGNLVALHQKAQRMQRQEAAKGSATVYSIAISNVSGRYFATLTGGSYSEQTSIDGDQLVDSINGPASWSYEQGTGFISGATPIQLTFSALSGKYKRTLRLFALGFTEDR